MQDKKRVWKEWRPKVDKGAVMSDWKIHFPELGVVRADILGRRIGSFLHGVYVQYSSDMSDYIPATFLTDATDRDNISGGFVLGLHQRLLNFRSERKHEYWIKASGHATECNDAAQALRRESVLPFDVEVTFDVLVLAHQKYLPTVRSVRALPVLGSLIRFCAWADRAELGEKFLAEMVRRQKVEVLGGSLTGPEAGEAEAKLRHWLSNPKLVRDAADAAFSSGRLSKLPVVEIV